MIHISSLHTQTAQMLNSNSNNYNKIISEEKESIRYMFTVTLTERTPVGCYYQNVMANLIG